MFHLKLLGTPAVATPSGTLLTGRATQRHRLALLAILGLAGSRGSSRDWLMATLWPESDAKQARNLLKVAVYVLRQALGEDAVLTAGDGLRLNPERVESDVGAFQAAVLRGDLERAVELYLGPFVDGFFLGRAPTFDQWVEGERERLARTHSGALEALAQGAEERGDLAHAVRWWEATAAANPYDSRVALRLMQVLEASGNPAGALQQAALHEQLLRREMGIAPPQELTAFVERIRSELGQRPHRSDLVTRQSPSGPRPAPAFRLQTFGGLILHGGLDSIAAEGEGAGSVVPLLAVLAAAGSRGMSRKELLLLFWPEASWRTATEQLDGVLEQIRRAIHASAVLGPDPLRLNPEIVASDVADFELAWSRASAEEALALYGGPFLAGFESSDHPELVEWVDARRRRLAGMLESGPQVVGRDDRHRAPALTARSSEASPVWSRRFRVLGYGLAAAALGALLFVATGRTTERQAAAQMRVARQTTRSSAARDLFDQGMTPARFRNDSIGRIALEHFRRAVEVDPSFAGAHAHLAVMFLRVAPADRPTMSRLERLDSARYHAARAIELDDSLAEGHAALGAVRLNAYEFRQAEPSLKRALELDPSYALAHVSLVQLYVFEGRFADALRQALSGYERDPASSDAKVEVARAYLVNDDCDNALAWVDSLASVQPPLLLARNISSDCLAQRQRWEEAIAVMRGGVGAGGTQVLATLGNTLAKASRGIDSVPGRESSSVGAEREAEARAILDTLLDRAPRGSATAYEVATVLAGLGETDLALDWLEKAVQERSLLPIIMHPRFEALRGQPRFGTLMATIGLTP